MRKKLICITLCFFLNIITFLSNNVSAVDLDDNHFKLFYNSNQSCVIRYPLEYNKETDLFFLLTSRDNPSSNNFECILLPNAKTNLENGGILSTDGSKFYNRYDDGNSIASTQYTITYQFYNSSSDIWSLEGYWGGHAPQLKYNLRVNDFIYSPIFIKDNSNLVVNKVISTGYIGDTPYFANTNAQLQNLSVGEVSIVTYDIPSSLLTLSLLNDTTDEVLFSVNFFEEQYDEYVSRIDVDDPFSDLGYNIPWNVFPMFQFVEGNQYTLLLSYASNVEAVTRTFTVSRSIKNTDIEPTPQPTPEPTPTPDPNQGLIDSNKETQNILNDQTNAIKENTETNKNIFQKIGDILSFINPFSENFFGRKLVELILDGIKSLFIPEDDFFSNYFDEIKQWFSDRLGFLWAPFDLLIELLNRILSINFSEPKFTISDINEPFTNNKIISAQEFNFNDLLENNVIKTVHDIYLILVDAFIVFNLYKLAQDKLEEVFTK